MPSRRTLRKSSPPQLRQVRLAQSTNVPSFCVFFLCLESRQINSFFNDTKKDIKSLKTDIRDFTEASRKHSSVQHTMQMQEHEKNRCASSLDNKATREEMAAHAVAQEQRIDALRQDVQTLTTTLLTPAKEGQGPRILPFVLDEGSTTDGVSRASSSISETESHRNATELKKTKEALKKRDQEVKSLEVKNKHLKDKCRVLSATPLDRKLRAKPRKQPLSENMENSINKHVDDKIIGRASRSSSRTALGDVNQDTSNPAPRRNLRRATRN